MEHKIIKLFLKDCIFSIQHFLVEGTFQVTLIMVSFRLMKL